METLGRFLLPPAGSFFLFGPRGVGKSTWIRAAFPDAVRIDLLDPGQARAYVSRPERLRDVVRAQPDATVVVLDEVQRAPVLLDVVHQLIEERVGMRFVMTGSSTRKLRRAGVNLLAGRAVHRAMHPFLAAELGAAFDLPRALDQGLVPLVVGAADPADALRSYLSLYIREEVQQEGLVRDIGAFARFLEAVSLTHGQPANLANIAADCETTRKAVEGYVAVLKDLLLCFRVPAFDRRARRKIATHAKLYWFDPGVFRSARPRGPLDAASELAGPSVEGLVAQHLRAWIDYRQSDMRLSFWRTRHGAEVDFVLYGAEGFVAIEVKNSPRVSGRDLSGLRAFAADYPEARRMLLHGGAESFEIDGVRCMPVADFLCRLHPARPLPVDGA